MTTRAYATFIYITITLYARKDPPEYNVDVTDNSGAKALYNETFQITHPGGKLIMKIEKALAEAAIPKIEELYEKYSKLNNSKIYVRIPCSSHAFVEKANKEFSCKYKIDFYLDPGASKPKIETSPEPIIEEKKYTEIILLSL